MSDACTQGVSSITDTPYGYTLSVIGGKWKMIILYLLYNHLVVRYNELKRMIGTITYKTLSVQLKELESDGLVIRKEYPQIPPKVEYSLSAKGESLIPIMDALCDWGHAHR
jgi:DNA-binding HxlR family transcriptional regulator